MITSLRQSLEESGLEVRLPIDRGPGDSGAVDLIIEVDGTRFAVERRARLPYPNEMPSLEARRRALAGAGVPLLSVPFVPTSAEAMLRTAGWSWADDAANFDLRAPGILLRQRVTTKPKATSHSELPQGAGSSGIIRALIRFDGDAADVPGVGALAAQAGVSQPRASQVLRRLHELGLVDRIGRGRWRPDRPALLDRFLSDYKGPGGSEHHYYTLDPLTDVAVAISAPRWISDSTKPASVAISADVGPDLIAPWRRPSTLIVYDRQGISSNDIGLIPAQGPGDANVIIRQPDDTSIFPAPALTVQVAGAAVPLADPAQIIWDLHQLGGQDRLEAAGVIREWLLSL